MGGGAPSKLDNKLKKTLLKKIDKLDLMLSEIDDDSLGLDFIHEKKLRLLVDIQLSGDFLESVNQLIEEEVELPVRKHKILEVYDELLTNKRGKLDSLFQKRYLN